MSTLRDVAVRLRNMLGSEGQRMQLAAVYSLRRAEVMLIAWRNGVRVELPYVELHWLRSGMDEIERKYLVPLADCLKRAPQKGNYPDLSWVEQYGGQLETLMPILLM